MRRSRLTAGLLCAAVLITACSSDDDGSTATSAPSDSTPATTTTATDSATPTTEAPAGPTNALSVGLIRPTIGILLPVFSAQQRGVELAAQDIADAGDLLEVTSTAGAIASTEVDEASMLADGGITSFIGPVGSGDAAEVSAALGERNAVTCSASATVTGLTAAGNTTLFRTAIPDDVTVTRFADGVATVRDDTAAGAAWRIGIIARSDTYGRDLAAGLANALAVRGMVPDVVEYHPFRQIFDELATDVAGAGYDAVVLVTYAEGVRLLGDLVAAGVDPARMVGFDSFLVPRLGEMAVPSDPTAIDGFRVVGTSGDRAFLERLAASDPRGQVVSAARAYDCAVVLALAGIAAPGATGTDLFRAAAEVTAGGRTCTTYADCASKLAAGEDIDYDGPSGRIALSEIGDPTFARFVAATVRNGAVAIDAAEDVDFADIERSDAILAAASFTTRLQQALTVLGFYDGPIDGIFDADVTTALTAFQASVGLPATGVFDAATDEALRTSAAGAIAPMRDSVVQMQLLLTGLGVYAGPIDGIWSPAVSDGIRTVQRRLGIPETGILDAATLQAIYDAGVSAGQTTTTTTVVSTTVTPTTLAPTTVAPTVPPTVPPTTVPTTDVPPTTTPTPPDTVPTLGELLDGDERFSILVELLQIAGFADSTPVEAEFTVFAPTNEAFEALDAGVLDGLRADPEALAAVLGSHIVAGTQLGADLTLLVGTELETIFGAGLAIEADAEGQLLIGGVARVVVADLLASNGVIHAIDRLLEPPA